MKLQLKNFRCYSEKEFNFGSHGLILMSGQSGCGKTSVLMAINFVLYGKGTKLQMFGKKSCKVEFEFQELRVVRTKGPNRLIVLDTRHNEEYEDAAAQSVINEKFGSTFDVTAYVKQNALKSFILMSPIEKLGFLEKFAFGDLNLTTIKIKCKNTIRKRNEHLISVSSKLEMAEETFTRIIKPERVRFPLKKKNVKKLKDSDKKKLIEKEEKRYIKAGTIINKTHIKLKILEKEHTDLQVLLTRTDMLRSSVKNTRDKIEDLLEEKKQISYLGDSEIIRCERQLMSLLSQKELRLLKKTLTNDLTRLEEMKESEIEELKVQILSIDNEIWSEYTLDDLIDHINDFKLLLCDVDKIDRLESSLETLTVNETKLLDDKKRLTKSLRKLTEKKDNLSRLELQEELYECPSCDAQLRFIRGELTEYTGELIEHNHDLDELKKEIENLQRITQRLQRTIPLRENKLEMHQKICKELKEINSRYEDPLPSRSSAEEDIGYFKDYKRAQKELEKQRKKILKKIEKERFSTSFQTFKESLDRKRSRLKDLKKQAVDTSNIDEEELRVIIETQKRNKEKIQGLNSRIKNLEFEKSMFETKLDTYEDKFTENYTQIRSLVELSDTIQEKKEFLVKLRKILVVREKNKMKLEKYNNYIKEYSIYKEWDTKVKELREDEKISRDRYGAAELLKKKILEAESIAIYNIIRSINSHAQGYLDLFFPVDPICVRLLSFKESKTGNKGKKPQINIQIDYKGMEADLSMLSGGELSRVVLAFTLALAEMFNSPLLMLDECTASLDQDLSGVVFEGIRKNFDDRLVLVIAHQVVSGDFDRVIICK